MVSQVLIIHLKRFSSSSSLGRFSSLSKNTSAVKLVTRGLDMSPYCNPKAIKAGSSATFDLIGVSNHSGNLGGGHYTALCKNFQVILAYRHRITPDAGPPPALSGPNTPAAMQDGKWYDFNDSHVSVSREPNGASQSAYVLFYRRRD